MRRDRRLSEGPRGSEINQSTLPEEVCEFIKRALFQGVYRPGQKISDEEIAKQLDVSRLSVREALSKLVESKVIEKKHWKGYVVRTLSKQDLESIVELRLILEPLAVRKFMKSMTADSITKLEDCVAKAADRLKSMDKYDFRRANFRFHEIIYEECGNRWLSDILENFRLLVENGLHYDDQEEFQKFANASILQHRGIIREFKRRDGQKALQLVREHVLDYMRRMLKASVASDRVEDLDD